MPAATTRDIRFNVLLRARPDAVYQALTSARELTRWWLLGAETDARNGGRVRMVWPRRGLGEREGVFVDLEPGSKVAWLFRPVRGERGVPALVSAFLHRRASKCELTFVHGGFPSAASSDAHFNCYAQAWEDGLAKLKLYLECGRTCKLETMDLESARILARSRR